MVVGEVVDGGAGRGVVVGEGRPEVRKVGGEHVCEYDDEDDDDDDDGDDYEDDGVREGDENICFPQYQYPLHIIRGILRVPLAECSSFYQVIE